MSRRKDDCLFYDEDLTSPSPNACRSDPNEVRMKKDERSFDDEDLKSPPPNAYRSNPNGRLFYDEDLTSPSPNAYRSNPNEVRMKKDEWAFDEDLKSPPPNAYRSNPNEVRMKKDERSFDEEDLKSPPPNAYSSNPNEVRMKKDDRLFYDEDLTSPSPKSYESNPNDVRMKKDDRVYDEDLKSPPPNVYRSNPNEVRMKKDDRAFHDEEKQKITKGDPPDGYIPARFGSWGTDHDDDDDIEDPGTSAGGQVLAFTSTGTYSNPVAALGNQAQRPNVTNVTSQRRTYDFPTTRPGAERVDVHGNCCREHEEVSEPMTDVSHEESIIAIKAEAELINTQEEERLHQEAILRAIHSDRQQAVVADVVLEDDVPGKSGRLWKLASLFLLIAIAIGVALIMTLRPEQSNPEPTLSAESLTEILSSVSPDGGQSLLTNSTPQNMAFRWMATNNTDLGTLSNETIIMRYALTTLFFCTNGDSWDDNSLWLDNGMECSGQGVTCTDTGEVSELDLNNNNLRGTVPPEIGLLTLLNSLDLQENQFLVGPIPTEIGLLTFLNSLELRNSTLTGPIPTEIGLLPLLENLNVLNNTLTGQIPTELGLITSLGYIDAAFNFLSGTVPTEIGLLSLLDQRLSLEYNVLTGKIPTEIGLLTLLSNLSILNNTFIGQIPSEIGLLAPLYYLDLGNNTLSGTVPSEINSLAELQFLAVHGNLLKGNYTCPAFITKCFVSCEKLSTPTIDNPEDCRSL